MRIALDCPADGALGSFAAGAARAAREGLEVELVGPAEALRAELERLGLGLGGPLSIVDAPASIAADADPTAACREKPDCSLMRAAQSVAEKRCQAFVTAAAPTAAAAAALWHLKRLRGVLKPALALPLATARGRTVLVDAGACLDCKPWHLLQFALIGSLYARALHAVAEPVVRLLAAGRGATMGGELARETLPLLKYAGVRFEGPIAAEEAFLGGSDVIVSDGLSGAVLSGAARGLSGVQFEMLESEFAGSAVLRFARRLADGPFARARGRSRGPAAPGAALLGVGGAVVVCREPADPDAVAETLRAAKALAESDLAAQTQARLEDMKSGMEFARTIE